MDRAARRDLQRTLETVGGELGAYYYDLAGPAIYRLDPSPASVIACLRCRHIALIPSIPRVPLFVHVCAGCGGPIRLEPPPAVWIEGSRPAIVLAPARAHRH